MEKKSVIVIEFCNIFNVFDEIIRRDLKKFEQEGLIEKNYGGVILKEGVFLVLLIFQCLKEFIQEKERIVFEVINRIKEGMVVILDIGIIIQ